MKYLLFIVLPALLLSSTSLYQLIHNGEYHWLWATLIFWTLMSGLGIATGFHRVYSHRCFSCLKPWLDCLLLFCGTIAGQGSSISWVAVHRGYHHPYSDTDRDPHTPLKGFGHSIFGWYRDITPATYSNRYALDLLRSRVHVFVHRHYLLLLYAWFGLLCAVHPRLALYGYGIALGLSILQDNLVNWLGHDPDIPGTYRNYPTNDRSVNVPVLHWLTWGQLLHNNHHAYPMRFSYATARLSEWDPCVLFLPLLRLGGKQNGSA